MRGSKLKAARYVVNIVSNRYHLRVTKANKKELEIADLVLQLGRAAYADSNQTELTPAQWLAMHFFARANRFSRTVSAFARYNATTKGTASQTVKALVGKGYLERTVSERDARSIRFDLTAAGRTKLRENPLSRLVQVASKLAEADQNSMLRGLRCMLTDIYDDSAASEMDVCALCGHLSKGDGVASPRCQLMNETLKEIELNEICVRFKRA